MDVGDGGLVLSWPQQLFSLLRVSTIRSRLLLVMLLMVLIAMIPFGVISGIVSLQRGRQQVMDKLESVVALKEAELVTWASNVETDLAGVAIGADIDQSMQVLLSSSDSSDQEAAYTRLHEHLGSFVEEVHLFDELLLVDLKGQVVLSTDVQREGTPATTPTRTYLSRGLESSYLHPPSYTLAKLMGKGVGIDVVRPVCNEKGQRLGMLVGRTSPSTLSQIMQARTGLGETGETYLVAANFVMLTEPRFPVEGFLDAYYVFSEGARAALEGHIDGSGIYTNHRGVKVVGVYRWLPTLEVALLAEQAEHEAMTAVYETFVINVGVAIIALLAAGFASARLSHNIAVPLSRLAETATRVSHGELDLTVTVTRDDEIGALAQAFNSMTARLSDLITGLEQRVAERTQTLHRRALQLETSTQVGREITSILDINELLKRVVSLIAVTFGYYHVGIYLVDRETDRLVFRAGSGQVTKPARDQSIPLEIGPSSLNGEVVHKNEAIVVNDVHIEPRFLADEMLPETQSELVVPLRVGGQVIGTLDVQSRDLGAFDEYDIRMLEGLGDQVAVAIENARLYARSYTLATVEERNRLARDLHDSVTQSLYGLVAFAGAGCDLITAGEIEPVAQYLDRIEKTAQQALNEMRLLLYQLRPPMLEEEGLAGALRQRLQAVEERVGIETCFRIDETIVLPEAIAESLYRTALEALNNALKHSAASSVCVELRRNGEWVELVVVDNGIGFEVNSAIGIGGFGIASMQERTEKVGGSVTIQSAHGEGTSVVIRVRGAAPLEEPHRGDSRD